MAYTLVPTELIVDGAVTSAKLDTNIAISGTLGVTGELTLSTHMNMGDNDKIKIGTGGDLEIYHDGSNSYISNSTGNIYLADTNGSVHIQAKLNEESIVCAADGAVSLYYDNSPKLATTASGVAIGSTNNGVGGTIDLSVGSTSSTGGITLFSPTDGTHSLGFGDGYTGTDRYRGYVEYAHNGDSMRFATGATVAMRIDSSQNLLVGYNNTNLNTSSTESGHNFFEHGYAVHSRDGQTVMTINRLSNDGDIVDFRKGGSVVGSIGTANSGDLYIGNDDTTLLFAGGSDAIIPRGTAGATRDGAISLGLSSHRFNNLHLSGTANVGSVSSGSASSASEIIATSLDNGTSFGSNRMLKLVGTSTTDNSRMGIHFTGNTGVGNGLAIIEAVNEDQSAGHTSLRMHTYDGSWNTDNLVLKSGNVGIGTSSTSAKLTINNSIATTYTITGYAATPANSILYLNNTHGGSNTASLINFRAGSGDGVIGFVEGGGTNDADFVIQTDGGSNGVERLRITNSGNVGIGTGIPDYLLEAYNGDISSLKLTSAAGGNAVHALRFRVRNSGNTSQYATLGTVSAETVSSWGGVLTFSTKPASGSPDENTTERMRIDSSGNVGIAAIPSGEASAAHVVRLGDRVCIAEYDDGSNPEQFNLFHNSDSSETYIETGSASVIQQRAGEIIFKSAASGSAGAAISFAERMRINSAGQVKISCVNNSYNFQAFASDSDSFFGVWDDGNDSANIQIDRSDTATVFYVMGHTGNYHFAGSDVSDRDLKENIKDVPNGSLELVKQLKPRTYNFKSSEGFDDSSRTGFIAQEVADVMTTDHRVASGTDGDKDMGIDPVGLIAHLTKAIQEQQTIIDDLKSRIETLEG